MNTATDVLKTIKSKIDACLSELEDLKKVQDTDEMLVKLFEIMNKLKTLEDSIGVNDAKNTAE